MFAMRSVGDHPTAIRAGEIVTVCHPDPLEDGTPSQIRVRVKSIRDLLRNPLTPWEFARRPYARWSRFSVYGEAIARPGIVRRFDLGLSTEYRAPGLLKVGLYEPGAVRPKWLFPRAFGETRDERALLVFALREWSKRDLADLQLRVYADDLGIVSGCDDDHGPAVDAGG